VVRPEYTTIFSVGAADQALILVVHRRSPHFWREVSYGAAVRRLAVELGLLVNHRDFMAHLDELGRTDSLTGLSNRRELMARLEHELASTSRRDASFAVVMIDLDYFKQFNDEFGHLQGDRALVELGQLLRDRTRGSDLAARYGGEEFCVVLHDTDLEGATTFAQGILEAVGTLGTARPVTCSAGVATSSGHASADSLLRSADAALYYAKESGRARYVVAPPPPPPPSTAGWRVGADPTRLPV
jgi:diguanylate cyclase (GGDEF)-like protein